jgi:hypothetical protein
VPKHRRLPQFELSSEISYFEAVWPSYRDAPIPNVHYDPRISAVLKRIQALRGDLGVKGIAALARCDEKIGHHNKQACTRHYLFGECTFVNCRHDHSSNPSEAERTAAVEMMEKALKAITDNKTTCQRGNTRKIG